MQAAFKARKRTERSKKLAESRQDIYLAALKARGQLGSSAVGPACITIPPQELQANSSMSPCLTAIQSTFKCGLEIVISRPAAPR